MLCFFLPAVLAAVSDKCVFTTLFVSEFFFNFFLTSVTPMVRYSQSSFGDPELARTCQSERA